MKTVVIACGGTGGHLYPGVAVGQRLMRRGYEVILVVSPKKIDAEMMQAHPEFKYVVADVVGWPGVRLAALGFFVRTLFAVAVCLKMMLSLRPCAVLGMGGFGCVPVLVAARLTGIPSYLHESNAIPGKATRLLNRVVERTLLGVAECRQHLLGDTTEWTGTPLRAELLEAPDRQSARVALGIGEEKIVLLIMGGSQGARGVNDLMLGALDELAPSAEQLFIIHLTGPDADASVADAYQQRGIPAKVLPFSHDMGAFLAAADIAVARAGASTLAECAWFALPTIMVPYPYAAEKHQDFNAHAYASVGGGVVVEESSGVVNAAIQGAQNRFSNVLCEWVKSPQIVRLMRENLIELKDKLNSECKDSAERVVAAILRKEGA